MAYSEDELTRINFIKSFGLAGTIVSRINLEGYDNNEIAETVLELAKYLNGALEIGLAELGVAQAGMAAETPNAAPQNSSDNLIGTRCPTCEAEGRNGVLESGINARTGRGPKYTCSLRERAKRGDKYVDVGECDYTDWGGKY